MHVERLLRSITDLQWKERAKTANYNVAKLAASVPCSIKSLARFFKKTKNATPLKWMKELRMEIGFDGVTTNQLVKEAAINAGYTSCSNFCSDFKERFKVTPSQAALGGVPPQYSPRPRPGA